VHLVNFDFIFLSAWKSELQRIQLARDSEGIGKDYHHSGPFYAIQTHENSEQASCFEGDLLFSGSEFRALGV
jgi:hypothetical protein